MRLGLEDFLERNEISLEEVRKKVEADVGVRSGDVVFAGGSLAEGLGHARSDLDLYLLTDRAVESVGQRVVLDCNGAPIDLELWPWRHVEGLLAHLDSMPADALRDPRDALAFSEEDRELLHRLRVGIPVFGEGRFRSIAGTVDRNRLARVLFDRACARIGTAQADVVGLLEIDDAETVIYLVQMLAGCAADCVLSATGDTNSERKWRFAKLTRLVATDWDADLLGGPVHPDVASVYLELLCPREITHDHIVAHAHECIRFANRVIPWGQERFLSGRPLEPTTLSAEHFPPPQERATSEGDGAKSKRLAPDLHIRYEPEGYKVYPFGGGRVLSVNRLFAEAVVLYDGKTSSPQVVERLAADSPASREDLAAAVDDIETFLEGEGWLVPADEPSSDQ